MITSSTSTAYSYNYGSWDTPRRMICDHAEGCDKWDCEWYRPERHASQNLEGECVQRGIMVKTIPYVPNGKMDPNTAFRMRKKK